MYFVWMLLFCFVFVCFALLQVQQPLQSLILFLYYWPKYTSKYWFSVRVCLYMYPHYICPAILNGGEYIAPPLSVRPVRTQKL